jgi:hypothetical protein
METDSSICSRCAAETGEVKVLRPDERDDFNGLTIQQGGESENATGFKEETPGNYEYRSEGPGHRVYVRQVSFGSHMGFLTKLLIVAVILFLVFVALPIALIVLAVSSLIWWLVKR